MIATRQHLPGLGFIRLFGESHHPVDGIVELFRQQRPLLDVAITCGGEGRGDAERDQVVPAGHLRRHPQHQVEQVAVADEMVGRQDEHDRLGVALRQHGCRQADHRSGAARHRFDQKVGGRELRSLGDELLLLLSRGDHVGALGGDEPLQPVERALEERTLAQQRQQVLGVFAA